MALRTRRAALKCSASFSRRPSLRPVRPRCASEMAVQAARTGQSAKVEVLLIIPEQFGRFLERPRPHCSFSGLCIDYGWWRTWLYATPASGVATIRVVAPTNSVSGLLVFSLATHTLPDPSTAHATGSSSPLLTYPLAPGDRRPACIEFANAVAAGNSRPKILPAPSIEIP